jgi:hypothetical protein
LPIFVKKKKLLTYCVYLYYVFVGTDFVYYVFIFVVAEGLWNMGLAIMVDLEAVEAFA